MIPTGHLSVQHLYGRLSCDGFVLEQVAGIAGHDQVLRDLTEPNLPMAVLVSAGSQCLQNDRRLSITAGDAVVMAGGNISDWQWIAGGGQRHRLTIVRWTTEAYARVAQYTNAISRGNEPQTFPASPGLMTVLQAVTNPPSHLACLPVWYQAKVMEVAALALYPPTLDASDTEARHLGRERIEKAMFLLERDLRNPPNLEMLAQELGCGVFHLSRIFKEHAGRTIPEFLRQKRMARAAEALANARQSISDIVLDVGYESFSAFTRAFVREFGVTPSQYRRRFESK